MEFVMQCQNPRKSGRSADRTFESTKEKYGSELRCLHFAGPHPDPTRCAHLFKRWHNRKFRFALGLRASHFELRGTFMGGEALKLVNGIFRK